ncbi:porin [Halofilum ochraceum]|uniref:porin n=1 Tax=Halofilum ochraceum TaxID=1611323 RepID=UPI0008DA5CF1|nr:porin [Halofilum ochraceum]
MTSKIEKNLLAAAVAGAIGFAAAPAQAVDAEVSGFVNRAFMSADDGEDSRTTFVDNTTANSRFRFTGSQEIRPDLRAGVFVEFAIPSSNSSAVSIQNPSTPFSVNERHVDAFIEGGFGKVSLGQGDGAGNGAMEVDQSGTFIAGYSAANLIGGGVAFRNENTGALGPTIGATYSNFDFYSRHDRVRYDTPTIGPGLMVSVSYGTANGQEDATELVARQNVDVGFGQLSWALGTGSQGGTGTDINGGSGSLLLDNGINVTLAAADAENNATGNDAGTLFYTKVGYTTGPHSLSGDYGNTEDRAQDGDESEVFGVQYLYRATDWMDLYVAGKQHSLDRDGTDFDDINILFAGTRVKF